MMNRLGRGWQVVLVVAALAGAGRATAAARHWTVGFVADGPAAQTDAFRAMLQEEVAELARGQQQDVRFPQDKSLTADWTVAGVRVALDRLMSDPEVDMVLALGVAGSAELARRTSYPKPALALFAVDPELQGLPLADGVSGVKNFTYLARPAAVERDLQVFREIVPFRKVAVFYQAVLDEASPEVRQRLAERLRAAGVELAGVPVGADADAALAALPADADAVYLTPLPALAAAEWDRLVRGLIERKLPTFSLLGRAEVERGVLAGLAPETDLTRLARRAALDVQRIVRGEDPARFPVAMAVGERLTLNLQTARSIGYSPRFDVLTEADLLHQQRTEEARELTLETAVREAIAANLDLQAEHSAVAAGAQLEREARAELLPSLGLSTAARLIDSDRAGASFGAEPQRNLIASLELDQVVYSEPARANVAVQKHLQRAREAQRDELRLDVAEEAATGYLNVLRAKTLERVQRENLQLIRANLELARVRQSVGSAGPAEVYRWEAEIAEGRKDVIAANSQRNVFELALNRTLNLPVEAPFLTTEVGIEDPELLTAGGKLFAYRDNPRDFRILRDFLVERGLARAPELAGLNAALMAQQRTLLSARRAFWTPEIGLSATLSQQLYEGGAGTTGPDLPLELTQPDDASFSIGLRARLPLYAGGSRAAVRDRASADVQRLTLEEQAAAERVEQRIRVTLHQTGATYASIELSRAAATAAHKNLDLISDAYSRGTVAILDLLDAQNAALVADEAAANAVHDFLLDLMRVERAVGGFAMLETQQQRDEFFEALDEYFGRNQTGASQTRLEP